MPPEPATLVSTSVPSLPTSPIGKAEAGEAGHVLDAGVGEIAAADLPGAFEQVADHRALAQQVPVVHAPAEFVQQRRQHQRRVGHPAGDDDVRALRQRVRHRLRAEIGIGRQDAFAQRRHRQAGVVDQVVAGSQRVEHVVAGDGGDLQPGEPSERAMSRTLAAAAAGLAAPMLVMMRMPFCTQAGSTASMRASSSGS